MYRMLGAYLKRFRKECILAPLFKMLEASFELFVPLMVAKLIDSGIASGDRGLAAQSAALLVALAVVGLVSAITAQYFAARAATGFATGVRHALFERLTGMSYAEMDRMGGAAMMTRMTSDVNQAQSGVNLTLRLFLRSPFVVFGAAVMAFTIDARCALIFVCVIALLSIAVFANMFASVPLMKDAQKRLETVLGAVRENLSGARVIRAFRMEKKQSEEFDEKSEHLRLAQMAAARVSGLMNPVTYVIVNFCIVWLIRTGAIRVNAGSLTPGQVVALYNYMSQILVELIKLANLIVTMNKAAACWGRIADALTRGEGMAFPEKTKPVPGGAAVTFEHVTFAYPTSGVPAVEDVSFTVPRGSTLGIIGGTGAGKSTVVNLIPRFYDPQKGQVRVDGLDARDYTENDLRMKIGIVPQKAVLFRGTIAENLRWGNPDATDETLLEAVHAAQADDVLLAKGGLNGSIEQGGRNLSGGQRQRLTIARALVRKPEILILDDSASALDQATDARLRAEIQNLAYHPTVIIVSQRVHSIRRADQILVMDDGHPAGLGTHETLMRDCAVYREIVDSQEGEARS